MSDTQKIGSISGHQEDTEKQKKQQEIKPDI